ncbi:hypothetical protein EDD86DRAFT_205225 [Gorgonomyces haynaldii]|nr:hypothetical protein EDD86DRAFT_205225 [Gorgonomyces haynaldii]
MSEHNGTAFCRIMPLGGKPKPEKQAPKPVESTKELEINSTIDPHDLGIKLKKAEKFLQKGIRVQFTLTFRAGGKNNMELYESITQELQDLGTPVPGLQKGRKLSFAIKPKSKK